MSDPKHAHATPPEPAPRATAPKAPAPRHAGDYRENEVCITDGKFTPDSVSIKAGGTVCWKNDDTVPHTVTFSGPQQTKAREFDPKKLGVGGESSLPPTPTPTTPVEPGSGAISPGARYEKTFATAGTYAYHCDDDADMKGVVTVS